MKKVWILFLLLLPLMSQAQNTEGQILFEEKMNMHVDMEVDGENEEMMEQLKAMLPEHRITKRMLTFTETTSIYKNHKGTDEPMELSHESEGMAIHMKFEEPENILFKDLDANRSVQQQEFFTRKFLIKDDIENFKWKLTGESKEVMGYTCQQATSGEGEEKVIAWFAPEIPVSGGPGKYGQLPGMILELEAQEGKLKIYATAITFEKVDKKMMDEPKKGKVVSRDEFKKIQEEKMKEMQMEMGGSGGGRIIIRN